MTEFLEGEIVVWHKPGGLPQRFEVVATSPTDANVPPLVALRAPGTVEVPVWRCASECTHAEVRPQIDLGALENGAELTITTRAKRTKGDPPQDGAFRWIRWPSGRIAMHTFDPVTKKTLVVDGGDHARWWVYQVSDSGVSGVVEHWPVDWPEDEEPVVLERPPCNGWWLVETGATARHVRLVLEGQVYLGVYRDGRPAYPQGPWDLLDGNGVRHWQFVECLAEAGTEIEEEDEDEEGNYPCR